MAGPKSAKRVRPADDDSDIEIETKPSKSSKKAKTGGNDPESGKDNDGNPWWSLSGKRRVGISEFQKKPYVNIREYYVDGDANWKPGKKGISLPLEQYNALLRAIPAINAELASQGLDVAEIPSNIPSNTVQKPSSKEKRSKKANIEATSDEEDDDEDED
ncbi:putative Transcriptional coactivator p15 (PC4) C-terminal domain-containing protein [Seiridium cardinale]|uniref:Transcriptional coactivator p15 (PC4) C-terminal domain-containing protein n=1 Tax=Seiridium cardinale TaxID=138064 RepID=A0ABR2Y7N4_9PEZI